MRRFDRRGMLKFPELKKKKALKKDSDQLVVSACYCSQGHSMVSSRVKFEGHDAILIKVQRGDETGLIALSSICGDNRRASIDIELKEKEIYSLMCPACGSLLPVYSPCECGAQMVTLFADSNADYRNCIGICNRIGCTHAEITDGGKLFEMNRIKASLG